LGVIMSVVLLIGGLVMLIFSPFEKTSKSPIFYNSFICNELNPQRVGSVSNLGNKIKELSTNTSGNSVFCVTDTKSGSWDVYHGSLR
jgi:MFS-type transporter involved in bile tolerance (Atg22 family)